MTNDMLGDKGKKYIVKRKWPGWGPEQCKAFNMIMTDRRRGENMAELKKTGKPYNRLTKRQRDWLDHYREGKTQTEAARLAGYRYPEISGYHNKAKLAVYITEVRENEEDKRIASIEEAKEFFTAVMRDEALNIKDRFKAGEILLKLEGGFNDKDKDGEEGSKEEITVILGEAEKYSQ